MKKYLLFLIVLLSTQLTAQTVGIFQNDSTSYNGYTLLAPMPSTTTYLIDNCGEIVNTWNSNHRPGNSAYLLEDGSLLRTARVVSSTFAGGGIGGRIERFDWNGNLIWSYNIADATQHQHHDIEYLPNGNILVLAWDFRTQNEAVAAGRNPSTLLNGNLWSEKVFEIQPIGTDSAAIVWEWFLFDHLVQDFDTSKANYGSVSAHPERINLNYVNGGSGGPGSSSDWIHANSLDYNAQLDQIVISCRNFDEFWVIDHSTSTIEAATSNGGNSGKGGDILYRWGNPQTYKRGGVMDQQLFDMHDVQWIEDGFLDAGKFLVFNNGLSRVGVGDYSSVEIISAPVNANGDYTIDTTNSFAPLVPDWIYTSTPTFDFFSSFISGASRLPNGNTLVCEGDEGRLFEIDNLGNIVWEYISPVGQGGPVSQGNPGGNNTVFRVYRYGVDYPAFVGKTLTPQGPIELNPIASTCQIYDSTSVNTQLTAQSSESIRIIQNPVTDILKIENLTTKSATIKIINMAGQVIYSTESDLILSSIPIHQLTNGIYIVQVHIPNSNHFFVAKILKI